jgi:hypothetical protein
MGLRVEYATIREDVDLREATKTETLRDHFEEDALLLGRLKRKGHPSLTSDDIRLVNAILVERLAGYVAVELAELDLSSEGAAHFADDRAVAVNILNHLAREYATPRFKGIWRKAEEILRSRWEDVERLAARLLRETTVYFDGDGSG